MTGHPNPCHNIVHVTSNQGSSRGISPAPRDQERAAFGLDLGGYSAGGSALVRATRRSPSEVAATVYRGHAFSKKPAKGKSFVPLVEEEVKLLAACLRDSVLYVDVPIDLQGLPHPRRAVYAWELVKRPVDFALGALPPLADRIGSVVARFQNLLYLLTEEKSDPLDDRLYETYPAGSLRLLGLPHKGYKIENNRITYENGTWVGSGPKGEVLASIASGLRMTSLPGEQLNHDELDAVVCALTGVVDRDSLLQEKDLETAIKGKVAYDRIDTAPPRGYVLMRRLPEELTTVVRTKTVRDNAEMLGEITGR